MTLTLTIANVDRLDNGSPVSLVLDRAGGMIGRSTGCDWSLPDPRHLISSRHCQITFRDGVYTLTDVSTNGTLLNGGSERMAEPRRIEHGDRFRIGHYEIVAALGADGGATAGGDPWAGGVASAPAAAAVPADPWGRQDAGWDRPPSAGAGWDRPSAPLPSVRSAPPPVTAAGWPEAKPVAAPADHGAGPGWDPFAPAAATAPNDDWLSAPASLPPALSPPSAWPPAGEASPVVAQPSVNWPALPPATDPTGWAASPAVPEGSPWPAMAHEPSPARDDLWDRIADDNAVDWSRGGFDDAGASSKAPAADWSSSPGSASATSPVPPAAGRDVPTWPPGPTPVADVADPTPIVDAFARAAGLEPGRLKASGVDTIGRAGALMRRLVAGLVVMVEARARAKSQLGAEATSLNFAGNNPIKFARTPEQALALLLNPQERGFMEAGAAIEDAFHDLQSHQIATLKAMQGALRATLDRFSPTAIRARAESKGLMARIMPGAREAALWQAYEREFGGVAQGSDEAFMDVFAKEFRRAYEDEAERHGRRS